MFNLRKKLEEKILKTVGGDATTTLSFLETTWRSIEEGGELVGLSRAAQGEIERARFLYEQGLHGLQRTLTDPLREKHMSMPRHPGEVPYPEEIRIGVVLMRHGLRRLGMADIEMTIEMKDLIFSTRVDLAKVSGIILLLAVIARLNEATQRARVSFAEIGGNP